MKPKKLLPLIVILSVLVVLVVLQKQGEEPYSILDETSLTKLLPDDIDISSLKRLEIYRGENPEDKLVIERKDSQSSWLLPERYNAVVDEKKIADFLDTLTRLKGEFRSKATSETQLGEYELNDKESFHVTGLTKSGGTLLFHVLAGKSLGINTVFMRTDGGDDVYVADVNLAQQSNMGVSSATEDKAAPGWLKKKVLENDIEKLRRIELSSPDRRLVFERREKPSEATVEGEVEAPDVVTPVQLPEYEWILFEAGAAGTEFKDAALDRIKRAISAVSIEDVVDPSKLSEWGMDNPDFKCNIILEGQDDVVLDFAKPDYQKSGYLRITSSGDETIYQIANSYFQNLYPKASDIFDMPKLSMKQEDITRIELEQADGKAVLAKKEGTWVIEYPVVDLESQSSAITTIARTLATFKADDYADSIENTGLDESLQKVTFFAGEEKHTITSGVAARGSDGFYSKLDDNPMVLVSNKNDVEKIFIKRRDLFVLRLLDLDEDNIRSVSLALADGQSARLEKQPDNEWKVFEGGNEFKGDKTVCSNLVSTLSSLQAADIAFEKTSMEKSKLADITVTMNDGSESQITIGVGEEDRHEAVLSSKKLVAILNGSDVSAIVPPLDSLKVIEAENELSDTKVDTGSEI